MKTTTFNVVVSTAVDPAGIISQVVISEFNNNYEVLMDSVYNAKEAGLREALIQLGWTQPDVQE